MIKKLTLLLLITVTLNSKTGLLNKASHIRDAASLDSNIVTTLKKGTKVYDIKKVYTANSGTWYKVKNGYISSELISEINQAKAKVVKKDEIAEKAKIVEKKKVVENIPTSKLNKRYFIGISTGLSKISVNQNKLSAGNITLGTQPDKSGRSINLEIGQRFSKNTFATISYSYIKHSDIKLENYLLSYNYKYSNDIYVGVVGGISALTITKSLINGIPTDPKGFSKALGIQVGYEKKINTDITFVTQYQYLKTKHKTTLTASGVRAELVRDNQANITFGIRWAF